MTRRLRSASPLSLPTSPGRGAASINPDERVAPSGGTHQTVEGVSVPLPVPGKRVDTRHRKGCGELPSGQRTTPRRGASNTELPKGGLTSPSGSVVAGGESVDHSLGNDAGRGPNRAICTGASRSRDSRERPALFSPGHHPTCASGGAGDLPLWSDGDVRLARLGNRMLLNHGAFAVLTRRRGRADIEEHRQVIPRLIAEELVDIESEPTLCAVLRSLPVSNEQRRVWRDWWREVRRG